MAKKLIISHHTVSRHIRNICAGLQAKNRVHLMFMTHPAKNDLASHPVLTVRENEIMRMILHGNSTACIAAMTGTSEATIRKHRENILLRLETGSMLLAAAAVLQFCAKSHLTGNESERHGAYG